MWIQPFEGPGSNQTWIKKTCIEPWKYTVKDMESEEMERQIAGYLLFCYTWMLKHWFQHNTLIIWLFADAANNREQNFKWISFGSTLKRILKEKGLKINTQASRAFAYISSSSSTDTAVITRPKHGILVWPSDRTPLKLQSKLHSWWRPWDADES